MAISRPQMMKELLPGLNALFGLEYNKYDDEHTMIYETESSDRSFEEEVQLSGFGQATVKGEGSAINYDSAQESFTARYNHETIALGFAITEEAIEDNLYDSLSARYTKALARAMAYYHDLGKTMNPTMFVENQIGYTNPHDRLLPSESANIIKNHVVDGVKLAKKFKIPEIVYQGILEHHGNAVLRYFYEKEKLVNPSVSKEEFRHLGQKPTSKESAILMLADSLEAACRAIFMNEDADEKKISNVIEEIFNEKISDGQLSNAPITFKELDTIKESFQVSLEGLYHQRVLYPEITEEE